MNDLSSILAQEEQKLNELRSKRFEVKENELEQSTVENAAADNASEDSNEQDDQDGTDSDEQQGQDQSASDSDESDADESQQQSDEQSDDEEKDEFEGLDPKKSSAWRKMRVANKELKTQLQEMRERMARLEGYGQAQQQQQKQQQQPTVESDPEPDRTLYPEEHNAWKIRKLEADLAEQKKAAMISAADAQWRKIEQSTQQKDESYNSYKQYLIDAAKKSLIAQNPHLPDYRIEEIIKEAERDLVVRSVGAGLDPVAVIKAEAIKYGFDPLKSQVKKSIEKQKPNINKINENQKKSASLINRPGVDSKQKYINEKVVNATAAALLHDEKLYKAQQELLEKMREKRFNASTDPYA